MQNESIFVPKRIFLTWTRIWGSKEAFLEIYETFYIFISLQNYKAVARVPNIQVV